MPSVLGQVLGIGSDAASDPINLTLTPVVSAGLGGSLLTGGSSDPLLQLDIGTGSLLSSGSNNVIGGVLGSGGLDGQGNVVLGLGGVLGGGTVDAGGSPVGGVLGGLGQTVTGVGGTVSSVGQILQGLGVDIGTIGGGSGGGGSGGGGLGGGLGSGGTGGPGAGPGGTPANGPTSTGSSGVQVYHTPNGDILMGASGDEVMTGNAGNDHFYGLSGNDTIDGSGGYDTAFYRGARAEYTGSFNGGVLTLADNVAGRDGTDTIKNVERISFTDSTVAFDVNGDAGQAYRIYQAAFDRTPDQHGLSFWVGRLDGGQGLVNVANEFLASPEFQQKYGTNLTNDQLVNDLYQNVLHRAGDAAGVAFWDNALAQGETRAQVLAAFSESPENHGNVDAHLANGILLDYGTFV